MQIKSILLTNNLSYTNPDFRANIPNYSAYKKALNIYPRCREIVDQINKTNLKLYKFSNGNKQVKNLTGAVVVIAEDVKNVLSQLNRLQVGREYDKNERLYFKPFQRNNVYEAMVAERELEITCDKRIIRAINDIDTINKQLDIIDNIKLSRNI